jgi:hypothetical protein
MARTLYILSICAIASAFGVFGYWLNERGRPDPELEAILGGPGVVEVFRERRGGRPAGDGGQVVVPLVAQAQAFALLLDPPQAASSGDEAGLEKASGSEAPAVPIGRPAELAVEFRLVATSCCQGQPERSMALLVQPGNFDGGRWVKEGTQIGHLTVHEIREGVIVLRSGDRVRELAVERTAIQQNLVREVRPATGQVARQDSRQGSAAGEDGNDMALLSHSGPGGELDITPQQR